MLIPPSIDVGYFSTLLKLYGYLKLGKTLPVYRYIDFISGP